MMFKRLLFFNPLFSSYEFVKRLSYEAGIDNSHNHQHVKEVLFWSQEIIKGLPRKLPRKDLLLIGQSCLLHDLVDKKYFDFSTGVQTHLENFHSPHEVDVVMKTISTMSYSKTVYQNKLILPEWLEESPFQDVFHITREADLLSSYNLARMIEFRRNKYPELSSYEIVQQCEDLYRKRMDTLVSNQLFLYPSSQKIASHLHTVSKWKLEMLPVVCKSPNLDILRIVNHLDMATLVRKMNDLPSTYSG